MFADLTDFQRDILVVVAGVDGGKGLKIKEELNSYYDGEINHGRLYPNLDTLVEKGLVDKFSLSGRSNGYQLTDRGRQLLKDRREWEQTHASDSLRDIDDNAKRGQIISDIDAVAAELGRMPKRNEFLDRTSWDHGDIAGTFDDWNAALESAGFNIESQLLAELERVASSVDGRPTSSNMNEDGAYYSGKYSTHFGSWGEAVSKADLEPTPIKEANEDEEDSLSEQNSDKKSDGESESVGKNGQTDDDLLAEDKQSDEEGVLGKIIAEFDDGMDN